MKIVELMDALVAAEKLHGSGSWGMTMPPKRIAHADVINAHAALHAYVQEMMAAMERDGHKVLFNHVIELTYYNTRRAQLGL